MHFFSPAIQETTGCSLTKLLSRPAVYPLIGWSAYSHFQQVKFYGEEMMEQTRNIIRVVIADDHEIIRLSIRRAFTAAPEIKIVGEAKNGREAMDCVNRFSPDVLLLDIEMPEMNGMDVIKSLTKQGGLRMRIIVVSSHIDKYFIELILEQGVSAYLTKDELMDRVVGLVREVAKGEQIIGAF
jgi:DNA-binding NarL/FixJ family response regulator